MAKKKTTEQPVRRTDNPNVMGLRGVVLDQPISGMRACTESMRLMKGHKRQLFRMDLSFWWYYALLALASAVGYLDVIVGLMGISLPIDPLVLFFGTLVLYCAAVTALSLWKKCDVDAAYVLAFEQIAYPEEGRE